MYVLLAPFVCVCGIVYTEIAIRKYVFGKDNIALALKKVHKFVYDCDNVSSTDIYLIV